MRTRTPTLIATALFTQLMPSLDYFLERTRGLCESLNLLQFKRTGIFTNAFNRGAPITRLLKDSAPEEYALYKIHRKNPVFSSSNDVNDDDSEAALMEVLPERKDGKSLFVDKSFNEYTQIKTTNEGKRTAVRVPDVSSYPETGSEPEHNSQTERWIFSACGEDAPVDRLCSMVVELVEKYPHLDENDVMEKISEYSREYEELSTGMRQYRATIDEQRRRLKAYNSGTLEQQNTSDEIDIDELIRNEEEAIEKLEQQLTQEFVRRE